MLSSEIGFFIKLFQYSTILPFDYDPVNRRCQKSNKLEIFSKIIIATFFVIFTGSVCIWFKYSKYFNSVGSIDILFMKISWIAFILYSVVILHEKFFKIPQLRRYANEIFQLHENLNLKNQKSLINGILKLLTATMIVVPITICSINFCYFLVEIQHVDLTVACI